MLSHLELHNVIAINPYGFKKGYYTTDAICDLTRIVHKSLYKGEKVIAVFIDLKKTFDC